MSLDVTGFHYNTALLEALDWDEDNLEQLTSHVSEYLEKAPAKDLDLLLNNVELTWGLEVKKILIEIFNIQAFALNLNASRSDDVN
tara:strand:- start:5584 stop:5841 length:258 start_codon:yes stop_codon:yes gene_type:complete